MTKDEIQEIANKRGVVYAMSSNGTRCFKIKLWENNWWFGGNFLYVSTNGIHLREYNLDNIRRNRDVIGRNKKRNRTE